MDTHGMNDASHTVGPAGNGAPCAEAPSTLPAPFRGTTRVPPDKSISHRALMLASMAQGRSHLTNLLNSQDVRSTLGCLRALGASIETGPLEGIAFDAVVDGWGPAAKGEGGPTAPAQPLDCGNSGTTARLLSGIIAGSGIGATLVGDASLSKRPMRRVATPLTQMGARFSKPDGHAWDGGEITLPLHIQGASEARAIDYDSPTASAQVKTSVLLAALGAAGVTSVREPYLSRNHTEIMLPAFGPKLQSRIEADGHHVVSMRGRQALHACDVAVPGDPSSAMFLVVAAALTPNSRLRICDVGFNPTRTAALDVARRMGCDIQVEAKPAVGGEPVGDIVVGYSPGLRPTVVEPSQIPGLIDEIPILSLLATAANGTTVFREVAELRVKESNRLASVVEGLCALGCQASEQGDDLVVGAVTPSKRVQLDAKGDHRLAMTWVLANRCFRLGGQVGGLECIDVSYPDFLQELDRLQTA